MLTAYVTAGGKVERDAFRGGGKNKRTEKCKKTSELFGPHRKAERGEATMRCGLQRSGCVLTRVCDLPLHMRTKDVQVF